MRRPIVAVILLVGLSAFLILYNNSKHGLPVQELVSNLGPKHEVIGMSVEGRAIDAYTYGDGDTLLLFIGGVHGGYEWNTVVLAYEFKDYLDLDSSAVPENLTVTIIPSLNPDGVYRVVGKEGRFSASDIPAGVSTVPGRFNANEVDLNRNFDCKWRAEGIWRNNPVKAGSAPFSEPEALALQNFVLEREPRAVVFWHSQSNAVYASECRGGILPETREILNVYAKASGYAAVESFDAYETSGDVEGWLASIGIPAITVELKTHETVEWEKNLAGIKALFNYYNLKE